MVTGAKSRPARQRRHRGFTYVGVLAAIAIIGIGLLAVSEVWVTTARRQKAAELEWIGRQFTKAIGSYYQSTPGAAKVYPATLKDLLDDRRYLTVKRHLRAIYLNPYTAKADWEPILSGDGRLQGVRVTVADDGETWTQEYVYQPQ